MQARVGGYHLGDDPRAGLVAAGGAGAGGYDVGEGGVEADLEIAAAHYLAQAASDV
jgi:hypothetical protein